MSLSFHRIISQRAVNKTVQYDNRLTEFTNPPIHTGDLYVKRDLYVNGTTNLADIHASGNVVVDKNVTVAGTIAASQFLPGQIIYTNMINITGSSQDVNGGGVTANIINYAYTPKNANSSILMEFQTSYSVIGGSGDSASAQLWVDGSQISYTNQYWNNASGGGTRSGVIFPIVGKYVNSSTSQKQINIKVQNNTDVDTITIYKDSSCWLKITEIGR